MAEFTLTRHLFSPEGIFGELTRGGERVCFTLEHSYDNKPKIPSGTYTCQRRLSPHFGCDLFELIGVPGCDFIEIHVGNYDHDSHGCILLGEGQTSSMLTNSEKAFHAFMGSLDGVDQIVLVVA